MEYWMLWLNNERLFLKRFWQSLTVARWLIHCSWTNEVLGILADILIKTANIPWNWFLKSTFIVHLRLFTSRWQSSDLDVCVRNFRLSLIKPTLHGEEAGKQVDLFETAAFQHRARQFCCQLIYQGLMPRLSSKCARNLVGLQRHKI